MPLTPPQIEIIRSSVPALQAHGETITKQMYRTLLDEIPELNNLFNQANQANSHQAKALAGALAAYAAYIDDLGVLAPAVEKICHKHASLYIQADQYPIVGQHLLRAMATVLGDALTPEATEAWSVAYFQLADIMIAREKELMAATHGWTDWRTMRIAEKNKESDEITSFVLVPTNSHATLPAYKPGQYISVMTDVPKLHWKQSRQYSLSDAPHESHYRISVKKEPGLDITRGGAEKYPAYVSNILHEAKQVGDELQVSHPEGTFYLDPQGKGGDEAAGPVVLLSAGVGVTPMIAILNTLVQRHSGRKVAFIHTTRSSGVRGFGAHVRRIVDENANVHSVVSIGRPGDGDVRGRDYDRTGRLRVGDLDRQADLFVGDERASYYVCGPDLFMTDVAAGLRELGIGEERIHMELFGTGAIHGA